MNLIIGAIEMGNLNKLVQRVRLNETNKIHKLKGTRHLTIEIKETLKRSLFHKVRQKEISLDNFQDHQANKSNCIYFENNVC
jgi:hypothetical protein